MKMQIRHKSFQKKYTEIRERISEVFVTDILRGKFEAISNIGRAVRADQGIHGLCLSGCCFYFHCNQRSHGTDKDVGFVKVSIIFPAAPEPSPETVLPVLMLPGSGIFRRAMQGRGQGRFLLFLSGDSGNDLRGHGRSGR